MSDNPVAALKFLQHEQKKQQEAWAAGRRIGLEQAAYRIEQLGGTNSFLVSPDVAAREIRALKDKDK